MSDRVGRQRVPQALGAMALAGALAFWCGQSAAPPGAQIPITAVAEAAPPPPPADAAPREASPPAAAPKKPLPRLSAGFCAPNGGEETFTIKRTLTGLLRTETERRLARLPVEARRRVEQQALECLHSGALPEGDAAETVLLVAASQRARAGPLFEAARRLAGRRPELAYAQVALAFAAEAAAEPEALLAALRRARALLPDEPALGWAIARALRDSADLDEAIDGLAVYLAAEPTPALARLRARLTVQRDIQRDFQRRRRGGITWLWPREAIDDAQASSIAGAVEQSLEEAARLTGTPRRRELTVVIYPGRAEILAVSCAQQWTGALYDGTLRLVAQPEYPLGVEPATLRHEALHAQAMPAAPKAPRWFHEGLAQFFAGQSAQSRPYWRLMVDNHSWIPFISLDDTFQAFEASEDAGLAYAQSLALIDWLHDSGGDGAIRAAVAAFQEGAGTLTALSRASGRPEVTGEELIAFLRQRLQTRP